MDFHLPRGAHARLVRHAQLAHDQHVQGRVEHLGDLVRHRHPTAGETEHHDVLAAQVGQAPLQGDEDEGEGSERSTS